MSLGVQGASEVGGGRQEMRDRAGAYASAAGSAWEPSPRADAKGQSDTPRRSAAGSGAVGQGAAPSGWGRRGRHWPASTAAPTREEGAPTLRTTASTLQGATLIETVDGFRRNTYPMACRDWRTATGYSYSGHDLTSGTLAEPACGVVLDTAPQTCHQDACVRGVELLRLALRLACWLSAPVLLSSWS